MIRWGVDNHSMVCTAVAHGSEWAKARVLVDSGSEHPPLISRNMADQLGLAGPVSGEATQADGAFLPLWDVGNVDMIFNNKVVSQKFLSAPLPHYDVNSGSHGCGIIRSLWTTHTTYFGSGMTGRCYQ